jgi:hypothetical protein
VSLQVRGEVLVRYRLVPPDPVMAASVTPPPDDGGGGKSAAQSRVKAMLQQQSLKARDGAAAGDAGKTFLRAASRRQRVPMTRVDYSHVSAKTVSRLPKRVRGP